MVNRWISYVGFSLLILFASNSYLQAATTPLEVTALEEARGETPIKKLWFQEFAKTRENVAEKYGTRFAFLFNYAQQAILAANHDQGKSRGAWYWNFELAQKLWSGAELFAEFEMDKGKGVDKFLPTFSTFNTNAGKSAWFYLPALYLEQNLFSDRLFLAGGKIDLSNWFDCNAVASSGDTQFLSDALVNNLTIPFPAKGIGAMIELKPAEWLYFQAGAATAKASSTMVGLSNAFNSELFLAELGLAPKFGQLQGNYRFIFHSNHERSDYIDSEDETKNNDFGFGISFDQAVTERITLFLRYGYADPQVRDIAHFWSCGAQLSQPIPGRKFDILAFGVAQSIMGKPYLNANEGSSRNETIYETYYSYCVNSSITLTPDIQIVTHPNAEKEADTEVVCGLRFLLSF